MRDLSAILEKINNAIDRYEVCKLSFTQEQSEILRDLSTGLYYLSEHRIKANEDWVRAYFESNATSSTAKEREADSKVPELYKIRHFMTSGYKVLESIRSTLSANK